MMRWHTTTLLLLLGCALSKQLHASDIQTEDPLVAGMPLSDEEYEELFKILNSPSSARYICLLREKYGCQNTLMQMLDLIENHGIVPEGRVCSNATEVPTFPDFCTFAFYRCIAKKHYMKRILCPNEISETSATGRGNSYHHHHPKSPSTVQTISLRRNFITADPTAKPSSELPTSASVTPTTGTETIIPVMITTAEAGDVSVSVTEGAVTISASTASVATESSSALDTTQAASPSLPSTATNLAPTLPVEASLGTATTQPSTSTTSFHSPPISATLAPSTEGPTLKSPTDVASRPLVGISGILGPYNLQPTSIMKILVLSSAIHFEKSRSEGMIALAPLLQIEAKSAQSQPTKKRPTSKQHLTHTAESADFLLRLQDDRVQHGPKKSTATNLAPTLPVEASLGTATTQPSTSTTSFHSPPISATLTPSTEAPTLKSPTDVASRPLVGISGILGPYNLQPTSIMKILVLSSAIHFEKSRSEGMIALAPLLQIEAKSAQSQPTKKRPTSKQHLTHTAESADFLLRLQDDRVHLAPTLPLEASLGTATTQPSTSTTSFHSPPISATLTPSIEAPTLKNPTAVASRPLFRISFAIRPKKNRRRRKPGEPPSKAERSPQLKVEPAASQKSSQPPRRRLLSNQDTTNQEQSRRTDSRQQAAEQMIALAPLLQIGAKSAQDGRMQWLMKKIQKLVAVERKKKQELHPTSLQLLRGLKLAKENEKA